jgi:hypothetical protein
MSPAGSLAEARSTVSAELARLDGGALTQALSRTAGTGVSLRIALDPSERGTRLQGRALLQAFQALSPGAQSKLELRWALGAGSPLRRLLIDDGRLLRWGPGQVAVRDDAGTAAFKHRFESRWAQALTALPETLILEDDLKSLPDPRDKEPRISRRKDPSTGSGQAPSAGSGQAQDNAQDNEGKP